MVKAAHLAAKIASNNINLAQDLINNKTIKSIDKKLLEITIMQTLIVSKIDKTEILSTAATSKIKRVQVAIIVKIESQVRIGIKG